MAGEGVHGALAIVLFDYLKYDENTIKNTIKIIYLYINISSFQVFH